MTTQPVTVVIVGAGRLAEAHARVVVAHPDLRLAAIVEPDRAAGAALIERIVNRFEGEPAMLLADVASALSELEVDIVAMGDVADATIAGAALAAGTVVVGGSPGGIVEGSGQWFPFVEAVSATGKESADAAFSDHLRQYENVLSSIGRGPLAGRAGADA